MSAPEVDSDITSSFDDDDIGQRILQNEELVQRIRESAENLSKPMTLDAFLEWLHSDTGESPLPDQATAANEEDKQKQTRP